MGLLNLVGSVVALLSIAFAFWVHYWVREGRWIYGRAVSKWIVCMLQIVIAVWHLLHLLRLLYNVHQCGSVDRLEKAWCYPTTDEHGPLIHSLRIMLPVMVATRAFLLGMVFTITVFVYGNPGQPDSPHQWNIFYFPGDGPTVWSKERRFNRVPTAPSSAVIGDAMTTTTNMHSSLRRRA